MLTRAAELRAAAVANTIDELRQRARDLPDAPPFATALRGAAIRVITEIKRSSPSKGAIAPHLDAVTQAGLYVAGGAAAISVLTEPDKFGGSLDDLRRVSASVRVPVLRKDFIVHPVQLWEARVSGAAAALLIVRALSPAQLTELLDAAAEARVETLVEIRDEAELERALAANVPVIGVNNRNLETLEIDRSTAPRIIAGMPAHIIAVAESGMTSPDDVRSSADAGADAILVGSSISASANPDAAVRALAGIQRISR
ncbi:MAG: indole-3-glycerol-phosphate synthase [Phycisphaerae bacterium]|nr:indole-3-glycerol-phosphate synthase [Gemmatimonadaceae bacterium]